jgi:hypothetical protein
MITLIPVPQSVSDPGCRRLGSETLTMVFVAKCIITVNAAAVYRTLARRRRSRRRRTARSFIDSLLPIHW